MTNTQTAIIAAALALSLTGCERPAPPVAVETPTPADAPTPPPAPPEPSPSPAPAPTPEPWQVPAGWTRMLSKEGKEMAYISREPISCRDGGDYCFEWDMMSRQGCPNGLYVEGQFIDPSTNTAIGWGNDYIPSLLPGQAARISIDASQGRVNISWVAQCQ